MLRRPCKIQHLSPSLILLLGLFSFLGGCSSVQYLAHVSKGQIGILLGGEPVQHVQVSSLSVTEQANLALVDPVLRFAAETGLDVEGQYKKFYASDPTYVVWVLTASPVSAPILHNWRFPIVGTVPYLGFFDYEIAFDHAQKMLEQGFLVSLRTAKAYSTLGWFADPIFRAQLSVSRPAFASTMLHELVHATAYIKGKTAWNESVASFTEEKLLFLLQQKHNLFSEEEMQRYSDLKQDYRQLQIRMAELRDKLVSTYRQSPAMYPKQQTAIVENWGQSLANESWNYYDGRQLGQRKWAIPGVLGVKLYGQNLETIEGMFEQYAKHYSATNLTRVWLDHLRDCAQSFDSKRCFE